MNVKHMPAAIALAAAFAYSTLAAAASVTITAPSDGDTLDAMGSHRIHYQVDADPRGDHVHLYVDDREVAILRDLKGSYPIESLAPGKHTLCIKLVNRAHTPIGVEDCVRVTLK